MTLTDTEKILEGLAIGEDPIVRVLPARPGQKEKRFVQLLSGEPDLESWTALPSPSAEPTQKSRLDTLEAELDTLKAELSALREDLSAFKKEFG
jgi:uncharacterized protein YceH (UPF0502 family)